MKFTTINKGVDKNERVEVAVNASDPPTVYSIELFHETSSNGPFLFQWHIGRNDISGC